MTTENAAKNMVPALPDLFDWTDDGVHIRSARCGTCGTYFFPEYHSQHRPGCTREGVEKVLLNKKGKLASYTIQYYMCPPPFKTAEKITPYGLALVEFPEGIQVAGLITNTDLETLKLGLEMETTTFTLYQNEDGQDVVTWAFQALN